MIVNADVARLAPPEKAAMIYAQARADVSARLWRAALGSPDDRGGEATGMAGNTEFSMDSLLSLLAPKSDFKTPSRLPTMGSTTAANIMESANPTSPAQQVSASVSGLGANAKFSDVLDAAASRTGIPAAALAAIVDAEAAKGGGGAWKTASRNPRSSAAGLGQFLGGTWQGEAERAGTWLHQTAVSQGWIGDNGRVVPSARSALLALRYDGAASINATADYARHTVGALKRAGIAIGDDIVSVSHAAYLGHHLGMGDAVKFLKGGLDSGRARRLLEAQVGPARANDRIAQSGDAAGAHRSWLLEFVGRHVNPVRFIHDQ
jgi:hypothetical protein